jgi:hypothetical protein
LHASGTSSSPPAQVEVSLDVLGALLGGAPAKSALRSTPAASAFIATLDAPRAWLSPGIHAPKPSEGLVRQFALEIAVLKTRCFDALVRMLIGAGHVGGLPSTRIKARMLDQPGAMRPARWAFEVVLKDSTGQTSPTSLGEDLAKLLARLLLVNDTRTPEQAEKLASEAAAAFTASASKLSDPSPEQLQEVALQQLSRGELADGNGVVHSATMRSHMTSQAIPSSLWLTVTKLMLRLQSNVAGFSFGDAPLLDLCAELATLGQHLDVATFGAMARRAEIAAVVRSQLDQLKPR